MASSNNGVSVSAGLLLVAVLLAASQAQLATSINSFLYGACKTIAGGSGLIGVTFCIDALSSDSRSSAVDSYQEFAVIAVDLLTTNATSTKSKIDGMLQNGGDDATTRCLRPCQAAYDGILQAQPAVGAAVKAGRYQEAIPSLEKSASAVKECESGFVKSNGVASRH